MRELFVRREYDLNGTKTVLEIDFVNETIGFVEKKNGEFVPKKWIFTNRGLEYMDAWQKILDGMAYAIVEASRELRIAKEISKDGIVAILADSLKADK